MGVLLKSDVTDRVPGLFKASMMTHQVKQCFCVGPQTDDVGASFVKGPAITNPLTTYGTRKPRVKQQSSSGLRKLVRSAGAAG